MKKNLKKIIQDQYDIDIISIVDAPRQFVAETYFINSSSGKYFCKIIDKQLFIPGIINSLPILKNINKLRFERISHPISTVTNSLHVVNKGILIVLFNFINAPQNYSYDNFSLGKLIAEIHDLTPKVTVNAPIESFYFKYVDSFKRKLNNIINLESSNKSENDLSDLMKNNNKELLKLYNKFMKLSNSCRSDNLAMVLTHGDAPGNILVKSPKDIYIIDWDDILLAPAERDMWFLQDKIEYLEGYVSVRSNYQINKNAATYYLFSRYFNDLVEYWTEILGEKEESHKETNFQQLKKELFEDGGWLYSLIKDFVS